jgi:hypothetical protein
MFKKSSIAATVLAGSLAAMMPLGASAQYSAVIQIAPPPPIHEVVPGPRQGYVWAPGHHEWRGDRYVWVRGHWMPERYGYEYRAPHWVQRGNGEWYMVGGNWERHHGYRDRDDRYGESRPNGDRDRDGVINRYDRHPNDPNRS